MTAEASVISSLLLKKSNMFVVKNESDGSFFYYPMKVNAKALEDKNVKIVAFEKAPPLVADGFFLTSDGHVIPVTKGDVKRNRLRKKNVLTFKKFADDNDYPTGKDSAEAGGVDSLVEAEDDAGEADQIIEMQVQAVHGN